MSQPKEKIILQEKASVGPLWYFVVIVAIAVTVYVLITSQLFALPIIGGAFLLIIVETVFTYPIKYTVFEDRLIARAGLIFKHEIYYKEIEAMEGIEWYKLYFYVGGNRIAGMPKGKVIIINPKTDRMIITPSNQLIELLLQKTGITLK